MNKLTVISLGLCMGCSMPMAQAADLPARGPIPFSAYDKDKNGTIDQEEFYAVRGERQGERAAEGRPMRGAASAPAFEGFDADGDGRLTEAELNTGQRTQMQQRPNGRDMGRGQGARGGGGANLPTFAEHDLNGDGRITEQEFGEAHQKRIEERAQQGGQMRNLGNAPAFGALDTNGDGAVTTEEFAAFQAQQRNVRPGR